MRVRWREDGSLAATAPTRTTLLGTRFAARLETEGGAPVLRGTAMNRSSWVWAVLLGVMAGVWFVVQARRSRR